MLQPSFIKVSFVENGTPSCGLVDQDHQPKSAHTKPADPTDGLAIQIPLDANKTLAQTIYLSGMLAPPPLCSGIGVCGQCKLLFASNAPQPTPEDHTYFSPKLLDEGWRLGCQHKACTGSNIFLPAHIKASQAALRLLQKTEHTSGKTIEGSTLPWEPANLGIDLGTTSVHWQAIAPDGTVLGKGQDLNPQIGAGSDVVSRMSAATTKAGLKNLQGLILSHFTDIVENVNEQHRKVENIVVAANPVMQSILLGLSTASLGSAPYSLPHPGGTWEHLYSLPNIWTPPNLSPFVGGDISAGYTAICATEPRYPFLLADLGTNGELLLAITPEKAQVCSVALGPALEGIGLSCGNIAEPGAITNFSLSPMGLMATLHESPKLPATYKSNGITATGYLSLLHTLLHCQIIDGEGHFTGSSRYIAPKYLQEYQLALEDYRQKEAMPALNFEQCLALPHLMHLESRDIEEFLKVKAAFSLGLKLLLESSGIAAQELHGLYIAGALGNHSNPSILASLGFIPQGLLPKTKAAGNTSLTGACILANQEKARQSLCNWAKGVEYLDLARSEKFHKEFHEHMRFLW